MSKAAGTQQFEEIRYLRKKRPPTLNQYLHRKYVGHVMGQVKGENGTRKDPVTGTELPSSSIKARDLLKGKASAELMAEHPDWVEQYYQEYGNVAQDQKPG